MSTLAAGDSLPREAEGTRRRAGAWSALALLAAALVPVASFVGIFPLVTAMPTWDQWSMGEVWRAHYAGQPVLPLLLAPYNGHRNVLPRMVFYGMGRLSGWNLRLEVVASYLAGALTLSLLLLMARRQPRLMPWLAVPCAAQVFSLLQYENYMSGYPFGQNLSQLFATATIFLLTLPTLGAAAFALAALAALGSTFSWGAGLATLPLGLVALWLRGERRPARLGSWLTLTLLAAWVVKSSASGAFRAVSWAELPRFYFTLLGKAWSPGAIPTVERCAALGVAGVAVFALLAAWAWRRLGAASFPWLFLGLYSLAAAGLIAIGRAGDGAQQALGSHYVTATYPLVVACAALALLLLFTLAESGRWPVVGRWSTAVALLIAAGFTLQPARVSRQMLPILRGWNGTVSANALAIARGVATDAQIRTSHHPDPKLVRDTTEVLREHRLAWFRESLDGESPIGNVDRLAGQPGGAGPFRVDAAPFTIEGWAVGGRHDGGPVRGVELYVDGRRCAATTTLDLARSDVADYFHSAAFLPSGWSIAVPAGAVGPGTHRLWVAAADFDHGLVPLLEADLEVATAAMPGTATAPPLAAAPATP